MVGSNDVAVVGAEDKRQITACVAASLRGDLLPLQLIFQGKTERSLPVSTYASAAARVDITHSNNHWSTQETMQRWIVGPTKVRKFQSAVRRQFMTTVLAHSLQP